MAVRSTVLGWAVAFCRRGGDLLVLMSTIGKSEGRGARHYRQGGDEGDAT